MGVRLGNSPIEGCGMTEQVILRAGVCGNEEFYVAIKNIVRIIRLLAKSEFTGLFFLPYG